MSYINKVQGQVVCSYKINSPYQLHFIYLNQATFHQLAKFFQRWAWFNHYQAKFFPLHNQAKLLKVAIIGLQSKQEH